MGSPDGKALLPNEFDHRPRDGVKGRGVRVLEDGRGQAGNLAGLRRDVALGIHERAPILPGVQGGDRDLEKLFGAVPQTIPVK